MSTQSSRWPSCAVVKHCVALAGRGAPLGMSGSNMPPATATPFWPLTAAPIASAVVDAVIVALSVAQTVTSPPLVEVAPGHHVACLRRPVGGGPILLSPA